MAGPANAMMGDLDDPTTMPETKPPEDTLQEERKMAKYSRSAEFKRLHEFMENRVKFYQRYLPDGSRVEGDPKTGGINVNVSPTDVANWVAACVIIKEFENILSEYENAAGAVSAAEQG